MQHHALIMAGGAGTRFWPASRARHPKQLLDLWGEPMLAATARRLTPVVAPARQWVLTAAPLLEASRAMLPEVPDAQVLAEPVGRNTAPCIGLAATILRRVAGEQATLGVFPADHFIGDEAAWVACLEAGYAAAARGAGIITLGVAPTRPETGYGYIALAEGRDAAPPLAPRPVEAFVEKPDAARAAAYLRSGRHLWNAGIFFFRVDVILDEIARQLPDLAEGLLRLGDAWGGDDWGRVLEAVFPSLPSVSIDHGVMEGARRVEVIPASFRWSDVGHWGALDEVLDVDAARNVRLGQTLALDTRGSVLVQLGAGQLGDAQADAPRQRLLVALGLEEMVVVDTPDALLVCPRSQVQRVREVVAALEAQGADALL